MIIDSKFARLAYLIVDLGADAIRRYFCTTILESGETLEQFLARHKQNIWKACKGNNGSKMKKLLHKSQYDQLFPSNNRCTPKLQDWDVTLLFFLIRPFHPTVPANWCGWNCPHEAKAKGDPLMTPEIEAIMNIKYHRNKLAHRNTTVTKEQEFENLWSAIAPSVVTLGIDEQKVWDAKIVMAPSFCLLIPSVTTLGATALHRLSNSCSFVTVVFLCASLFLWYLMFMIASISDVTVVPLCAVLFLWYLMFIL